MDISTEFLTERVSCCEGKGNRHWPDKLKAQCQHRSKNTPYPGFKWDQSALNDNQVMAASVAARNIAGPPWACTFTIAHLVLPAARIAPATVLGIS
jgi:hypothetical protein